MLIQRLVFSLILLSAFLFSGATCQQETAGDIPAHFEMESLTPEYLYKRLAHRQQQIHDLKAFVKTSITTPRRDQSFRQIMLMKEYRELRLDTLNPFNQPLGIFLMNGKSTVLFDLQKNKLYTGLEVWNMMHDMLGTIIDFSEYVHVFSGNVPRFEHLQWTGARLNEEKTYYELKAVDPPRQELIKLRLDAETLLPATMHKWAAGRPLYSAGWEDYQLVDGFAFPHLITVERVAQKDRVQIRFDDPVLNAGIDDTVFHPALPGIKPETENAPAS
jgi:hypothetical protein